MKYKARSLTYFYLHRSIANHPTNSSPSSETTSSSTTTSYTPPTNTKPPKSSHVSQHAFFQIKSSTPLTKPRSTVDHHTKVTLATPTRNAWSMFRISALCFPPFPFVDGVHMIHSAYKEEFGCNFTSAIPTNVFGPHDNLYVKRLSYFPFRRLNRFQRFRRFTRHPWAHSQVLPSKECVQLALCFLLNDIYDVD